MPYWNGKLSLKRDDDDKSTAGQSSEKRAIALKAASLAEEGQIIGAGSGSTSRLTVIAISKRINNENLSVTLIPTSYEIEMTCLHYGVPTACLSQMQPDWCFDGTDEVDPEGNLIKGRGGAMYREKLVMLSSPVRYILADPSKYVKTLGEKFPVPVEVDPRALHLVEESLMDIGATHVALRIAKGKDGPIITEKGNVIVDCHFTALDENMETMISSIPGVLESGLFMGYNPHILTTSQN